MQNPLWQKTAAFALMFLAAALAQSQKPAIRLFRREIPSTNSHDYSWVSNHEVVRWLPSQDKAGRQGGTPIRLDIDTGREQRGTLLARRSLQRNEGGLLYDWHTSPNGEAVLYFDEDDTRKWWDVGDIDGVARRQFPLISGQETELAAWMPDSRRWVETIDRGNETEIRIHSLDPSVPDRNFRIHAHPGRLLGVTAEDSLLGESKAGLMEFSLDKPAGETAAYPYPLPAGATEIDTSLSPSGIWLLRTLRSTGKRPAALLLPLPPTQARDKTVVWITFYRSRPDGSQPRALGCYGVHVDDPYYGVVPQTYPDAGQISPDGKRLSFFYRSDFCVFPISQ